MSGTFEFTADGIEAVLGVIGSVLGAGVLPSGIGIAAYVLTALSYYTIAQRRGIKHAWMSWVPVLNLWILGSIADQYRYVAKGEIRNRRKLLIGLSIAQAVLSLVTIVASVVMVVRLVVELPQMSHLNNVQLATQFIGIIMTVAGAALLMGVVAIVAAVFRYIALYDLYASCENENKTLYIVLSILFSITMPVFLFICRNKDEGMPPRRAQQSPVTEAPVYREPEEPWIDSEE